ETGNTISGLEAPGASDLEQTELSQIPGKRREGGGQAHDAQSGIVQHLVAGGLDQFDTVETAVTADGHAQHQAAIDALAAGLSGVVLVTDALYLAPPGVHVEGSRIAAGRRGVDPVHPGPLGILLALLGKLCLEAGDVLGQLAQRETDAGVGCIPGLGLHRGAVARSGAGAAVVTTCCFVGSGGGAASSTGSTGWILLSWNTVSSGV